MDGHALIFSKTFGGNSIFKDLSIGDTFYFPTNGKREVCTKISTTRYSMADGRAFSTGQTTMTFKLNHSQTEG